MCFNWILLLTTIIVVRNVYSTPPLVLKQWPPMKTYDIWNVATLTRNNLSTKLNENKNKINLPINTNNNWRRVAKVLNFFPVPVDDECLSDDGRRAGVCFNVYECRIQGGTAKGQCALGFGVCCVFTATCDQDVLNNITYIISPGFPAIMTTDISVCNIKIKMMSTHISQLRLDFVHFSLGQPNRKTGLCEGDFFYISGGAENTFKICGQNSGQHVYYDVGSLDREGKEIEIAMNFSSNFSLFRIWEIKVSQIPFSQRAPTGCLQYFTGPSGVIQTFNFAENGRHLANQNYRVCIRQELGMCSVAYEPCTDQSFRIGSGSTKLSILQNLNTSSTINQTNIVISTTSTSLISDILQTTQANFVSDSDFFNDQNSTTQLPDADEIQGSGGGIGEENSFSLLDVFSKNLFGYNRQAKQFTSTCTDRITMPCVVEDFIAAGMSSMPDCIPIHCGNTLCANNQRPCRIESTVTPFGIGVHFGDGVEKNPEENIGACLRYSQMRCT